MEEKVIDNLKIKETESLLEESSLVETADTTASEFETTLAETMTASTEVESTNYDDAIREQQRVIDEHNKRIMQSPEFKAQVVFENYVKTCGRIMTGPEKHRLKRECLRNAKKGRYDYLFDEEKIRKREERQKAKFEKLNKPVIHTVEELSDETKKVLQEVADSSVIPTNAN